MSDNESDTGSVLEGSFNTRLNSINQEIGGISTPLPNQKEQEQNTQKQEEVYSDNDYEYYDDDYYYYESREQSPDPVPIRKSKWHPQVGLSPRPDVENAKSQVDTRNKNYKPQKPRKVEIFNDVEYLRRVKSPKFGRRERSAARDSASSAQLDYLSPTASARVSRRQRSREGSLYRQNTQETNVPYETAFSKKGYETKPLEEEDWKAKNEVLEQERFRLQAKIKDYERNTSRSKTPAQHYKYYSSTLTQTRDRKTSAELKLLEVNRERKALENEERNFLIQKEHSQRKLEAEEKNFLSELKRTEAARRRVEQIEKEEEIVLAQTKLKQRSADKTLNDLEEKRLELKGEKAALAKEKVLEEERWALEEEKRKFTLEKEKAALDQEKKMFEQYKKNFQLGLQMEREELEREMFENYSVPNRYNEEIKPLKIDPFDD